jgi:hypothetical protein
VTGGDDEQKPPTQDDPFVFETSETPQEPALEGIAGLDLDLGAPPEQPGPALEMPAEEAPALSLDNLSEPEAPAPELPVADQALALDAPLAVEASAAPTIETAAPAPIAEDPAPQINVPASFPFSLMVEGHLTPAEQEKLLDILSRENMGIRELDLETQFQCGKLLIPRVSEYAGVLLVHALRTAAVEIKLVPSDLGELIANSPEPTTQATSASQLVAPDLSHPAEQVRVTQTDSLPDLAQFEVIGIMTASAILKTETIEAESSAQYLELLEGLTREMKFKAFRKGAVGIVKFQTQLTALRSPTDYRLTVTGTAIRPAAGNAEAAESPDLTPQT